jgi:uncharacterized protein (TIGR02186 family)
MVLLLAAAFTAKARGQNTLTVDLANSSVDITTGFDGANLILYGVKAQAGDLAIVLRGPDRTMTVRKKNRILGLWINTDGISFADVPSFYDFALSKTSGWSAEQRQIMLDNGIGIDAIDFEPASRETPNIERLRNFQEALVRNKQTQGLFPLQPKPIVFLNDNFFRTTMYIPSNVSAGTYKSY